MPGIVFGNNIEMTMLLNYATQFSWLASLTIIINSLICKLACSLVVTTYNSSNEPWNGQVKVTWVHYIAGGLLVVATASKN